MKRLFATVNVKTITGLLCLLGLTIMAAPAMAFHFTITSDQRGGGDAMEPFGSRTFQAINDVVGGPGAFHVSCGDIDYAATSPSNRELIDTYFGSDFPWYGVVGNHDEESPDTDMVWLRNEFNNANGSINRQSLNALTDHNGPPGSAETTYSWDYGNAHFIVLNLYWNGQTAAGSDCATDGDVVTQLYNWLAADLAATNKPFIFIFMHEPAFPYNHHYGDSLDQYPTNRNAFWSLLESEKVSAVFSGHTHYYSKHQGDLGGHTYNYPAINSWRTQDPNEAGKHGYVWEISTGNAGWTPGGVDAAPNQNDWLPSNLQWNGLEFIDVNVTSDYAYINVYRDIRPLSDSNAGLNFTLNDTIAINGDFLAYNDCVYDPGLVGAGTDPCGNSVHYGDPNKITTYGIGTESAADTVSGYADTNGFLRDYTTGAYTNVKVTLTQSGGVVWQPQVASTWHGGYDTAPNTDAYNTFHGIADMTGVVYYGTSGWYVDANFTGLDPNKSYTFATSASRAKDRTDGDPNGYPLRKSKFTISGIDSATNASTTGVEVNSPYSVRFCTGDNHFEGYVARWTGITPGSDGKFNVRAESGDSGINQAYAFSVFMLREEPMVPDYDPPTPNPMTWASLPTATGSSTITMTATTATEPNYPPVKYYFECTTDASKSSNWQVSPTYVANGLNPSTLYTFRVKARDSAPSLNETGWSPNASAVTTPASSTVTYVAAGTVATGTTTITPALPASIAAGDILLLFVETPNRAVTITNQANGTWTEVTGSSPQGTGTAGAAAATRLTAFWSRYNGTQTAPTATATSSDQMIGRITAYRGVIGSPSNPWDVTAGNVASTASASFSIPSATTTVPNTLVVAVVANTTDTTTAQTATWVNSNLSSLGERTDNSTTTGGGGGFGLATGGWATVGAYGATTGTLTTSSTQGRISIALKPQPGSGTPAGPASSPSPSTGATEVSITTTLSWTAGSSTTVHDVYFGTNSSPTIADFKGSQAGTTYDPGTLLNNTTYYWRIDEKSDGGTTTGTVWSFTTTTSSSPPGPATNPTPSTGATNIGITTDLSWAAGSGVATRDVYFGTVNPPVTKVIADGTALTYDTGTMVNNKTYYWRVDEKNTGGTTTGTVWSFATNASVPNVVGSAQADANTAIIGAGLTVGTITTECSNTVAAGNVISQNPTGGTQVNVGSAVDLVVSSGQPSVPDVTGQVEATAIANINAVANISYGSSTTECSDTVAAGNVISQSSVGAVDCGTVVNLVISSGQPSVPDVTGQAEATAIANINAVANISYGSSTTECSNTVAAGLVISQSATGTVTCGTVVNLVISSGQPSVPDVTGQAEATAIANINAVANISYGSSTTQCSNTVAAGNVISQSVTGITTCGTVVNLVISSGQPSVPDVTGQAQATAIANINAVANISYGSSTTQCSDTVAAGNVISQSATGTVTCGTVVNLVISSGQPTVPDVTGQAEATAIANINAVANISYGSSTTECSDTVAAGNVISQSVTGTVTCGTVVNLVISSGQPSVPDVTGQAEATAIANINAVANISYGSSTTECSDTVAAGNVISQSATGTVSCGTVVNLVISSGQPSVPDVTGQAEATAIANINAVANISYGSSTTECSNTVAAGNVISQSATGTVTCGTVVNLVISSGQPIVPDVTGQAEATAIANINAVANISYGSSTTQCSDTVAAGNVISQSVTGTTTCGTVVNLVISSGQPSVPDVTGQAEATAIANINAVANISYGSSTTQCSDTVAAGNVISQSATGTVTCGTVVNLVISSGQPSVPDVTGQAEATAIANINAVANISYGSSTTECSDTVAAGNVISQSATGTVTCGTVVNLVISSGQPSVPDVTGQAEATAIANINAVANISYGSSTTECSDTVAAGNVISQSATGTVTCGTVVNLVISSGQPSVPDVTGQAQATAIANINAVANISYGSSTTECSNTVAAGNVISQSSVGAVDCGTVVNLVISSGQPSVPDVTGQAEATAIANINAVANISYGSSTTECSNTVAAGNVISQSATGTVSCGTVVNLVISSGQPSVPDVTGQAEATAIANINAVANISYGSSTTECSNTVAAGNVISQSATGTVTCGTVVNLVISSGQPSVPDVTGQAQATAIANINAVANISYGSSTTECSNTVAAGNVISQSATGTVTCGTVVNLVISSGQPSVPDVTGQAEATAIANINAVANISYGSSTTECSNTVAAGNVISQSATGTVTCGTVVNLVISSGQPSVPDVTGQAEATAIANINAVANISYGSSTTECSDTVAAGNVISQSATGTVTCGTVVNLVISSGQPSVPDVTGQAEATAIANINAVANISYGSSTTECSNTVAAGNVISQSATGTVTCGTVVNLVISSGQPSVPDVTGQAEATAIANINAVANISYGSSTTECSDTVAAGNVISQSSVGAVDCGTVVNLVISSGQPSVPDVTGQAEATAIANINAVANISYGSSTTECSNTVAAGLVISQSATGTVTCGTVVNLVISSGQPSVPDVTGQAEATAIANINAVANISYGSSTTQCSDTVAAGLVISQSATGTVTCGTVVNLVISSGQPSVPDVTGQAEATAIANINAVANISYGSSTTECSNTVAAGNVISQSATGTVTCGTVVNLVISSGQPSVPDVTGQAQATAIANINAVANISYGSSTTECSNTVAAGNVISQSVTGITTCGTVVNLVISSGQPSVPDVTGQAEATAIANINAVANISYGSSTTECSNTVAAGNVISQSVTGITTCGTVVNLVISSGQPSVPDVTGQAEATAIANINAVANISYGSSTTECSNTVAAGNVISQSSVGAVDCGTVVNLVVSSGQPSVPDVTGQAEATAIANINAVANISYGSSTTECSDTVAAGNVISQSVTGITTCGTVVNLVISSGQPSVPDVTGQAEATAIANINAVANISYGSSTTECSDTVAAGLVISQSATGTVTCGTVVNLVISSGQPSVPDVTGQAEATAIANINAVANISYGSSTTQCSDTVAAGNVISQSVTGITTCGTVVNLVISSGQPSVPDVTGQAEATAIANINAVANISYGSSTTECSNTVAAGNVISQSATGTVTCGTVVNLVISSGSCVDLVPNVIGMTQAAAETAITAVDGLTIGTVTEQYSNTLAAGLVISQDPAGGTEVNDIINLVPPCVGHWKLNDNAASTTVLDSSGTGHNGTATRNTNLLAAAGKINGAFLFNGTSDSINVGNIIGTGAYTKVAWVKRQTGATSYNIISGGYSGANTGHAFWAPNYGSFLYSFKLSAGHNYIFNAVQDSVPLDVNVWRFVAVTYDPAVNSGRMVLYKDGVKVDDANNVPVPAGSGGVTYISNFVSGNYFKGSIDNAMIFNRALTNDEISALYNESNGTEVMPDLSVDLVVSLGKPLVPDIVGKTQTDANTAILAVDTLQVGSITKEYSSTVAAGNVISQNPLSGTAVDIGSSVDFVVSLGRPVVPDVTGKTQADANAAILAVDNLQVGTITTQYSSTVAAGHVISQNPVGGTEVDTGISVDFVVSLGVQSQQFFLTEDFNDNERSAMWRMTSYDPEGTRVSEYVARLNLLTALQSDLTANCVGHWKLNDNAANTTVLDSSGTGHNGTATRNTNLLAAAGKINGAFLFNGTSDSINVGNIIGTGAYTKVAWVKREVGATSYNIISGGYSGSNTGHAFWAPNYGSFLYSYKLSAGHNYIFNAVQDSVPLDVNVWRFVAVTYDPAVNSGRMVLYKDGVKVDDANNVPVPAGSGGVTYISNFVSTNYFKGSIDNAMIFNRALTSDEIATLYNDSNGTESLVEYTAGSNEFLANGWGIDANDNFEAKVDFHYSSTSSPASWVGMTIENDADNYISITAGANGSSPYFQYAKVVDGNVTSAETSRASNDGSLYISYDAALDKLYLSYSGYGASNAWQTITGLLGGQWSSKPLMISLGGGSDGSGVNNDDAYLDNFAASGSMFGWPPATDVDNNGFIDWADILVIAENWLATGSTPADIDGDGTVDFADFAELGLAW